MSQGELVARKEILREIGSLCHAVSLDRVKIAELFDRHMLTKK